MRVNVIQGGVAGWLLLSGAMAQATVILDLGTAGNAAAWTGSLCGTVAAPVFQFGRAIGVAGGQVLGDSGCRFRDGLVVTEYFYVPADARDISLRLGDFGVSGHGELRLNGTPLRTATARGAGDGRGECDDGCDAGDRRGGSGADGLGAGFLPGSVNRLEIAFGGLRPPGLTTGDAGATARLDAVLSFQGGETGTGVQGGGAGTLVPEPGTVGLVVTALGALVAVRWGRRVRSGRESGPERR